MSRGGRLVGSRVRLFGGALPEAPRNAQRAWTERRGAFVTLTDDDGVVGQGEASPLPGFSPDALPDCVAVLEDVHLRLAPIDDGVAPVDAVIAALRPIDAQLEALPAARFALETALLDRIGKRSGTSIAACLGGPRHAEPVPLAGLVGAIASIDEAKARAQALCDRGIETLKVKVGAQTIDRDDAALRSLREALGARIALRLDANGAWSVAEARAALGRLAPLSPVFVEEPTPGNGLFLLGKTEVPWAADESLIDPAFADRLLAERPLGCVAVVIKPALFGLVRARSLAMRAAAAGLSVVITHLFDGPVALAAAAELARSLDVAPAACGLDRHAGLSAFPRLAIPQVGGDAFVRMAPCPGLGLDLIGERAT